MIDLLKMCGFEDDDIQNGRHRIERAFDVLGITAEDISTAKERLNTYYDLDLLCVRKGIGLCLKETVNIAMAREDGKEKIIYGFMSPGTSIFGSALQSISNKVFVANLNGSILLILGAIFNKLGTVLEAAERKWLKGGKAYHCANVKTTVGLLDLKMIPDPDLLISSGLLCDTAPKTLDIIEELYGIPTCSYDVCPDIEFAEYPDSSRVMEYAVESTRNLIKKIEGIVGFEVTDSILTETIEARGEAFADPLRQIKKLQDTGDPVPIRLNHGTIWHCVSILSRGILEFDEPTSVLNLAVEELTTRVRNGEGPLEQGAPRLLSLLPSHFTDPRWEYLPYEYGMAVVSTENGFFPPYGKRTIDDDEIPEDPYERMLQYLKNSLNQNLSARIEIIVEVCKNLKVDGVLDRYHVGCRIQVPDALAIKEALTERLGIPVLLLEWEGFDPRFCNEERYRIQLDTFGNMLRNRTGRD